MNSGSEKENDKQKLSQKKNIYMQSKFWENKLLWVKNCPATNVDNLLSCIIS